MKCSNISMVLIVLLLGLPLLAQENNFNEREQEIIIIDSQFSKLSHDNGVNAAFLSYLADDGVLLRKRSFSISGKEIIKEKFFSRSDSGYTLTWKSLFADIAASGELGYTYGIYEFKAFDPDGIPIVGNGTYLSIWKKDQSDNWKLVLDTGNEGLEP